MIAQNHFFSIFHACSQDNFASVPKRVWADVVRKLGVNMNSRNTAADLFVPRALSSLLQHADAFCSQLVRFLHTSRMPCLRLRLGVP